MISIIDHTGTATKSAFCKIVLVSTSAKGFMDPIGIITITTCPKNGGRKANTQKYKMVEKKKQIKNNCPPQGIKKENWRDKYTNTQIQNNRYP